MGYEVGEDSGGRGGRGSRESYKYSVSVWVGQTNKSRLYSKAGSVSVFGVGIGIRYFRRYFFHIGSVFGIGTLKYLGIRYRYF